MGRNYKWLDKNMLTPKQLKLFNFLKKYKQQKEYMPTVREMQNYMKAKSTSSISQMLGYIEWKGYIKKHPSMARAIEIIKEVA